MALKLLLLLCCFVGFTKCQTPKLSPFPRSVCVPQERPKAPNCKSNFTGGFPGADTWFMLYNEDLKEAPENLHLCGGDLPKNTKLKKFNRAVVIIPSLTFTYCNTAVFRKMTKQLLMSTSEVPNIVAIDPGWANPLDTNTFSDNVQVVAKQTVQVLKNIKKKSKAVEFYLVGFGTGAHIAGVIAKEMKVQRITALDPWGPGFGEDSDPSTRLDGSEKAEIEDVWHTNMGSCFPRLGINYDPGNIIFYINGGKKQDACPKFALESLLNGDFFFGILGLVYPPICEHLMAAQYFQVSINSHCCEYLAYDCVPKKGCQRGQHAAMCQGGTNDDDYPTCSIMGYNTDRNYYSYELNGATKTYFVSTTADCPYCMEPTGQQLGSFAPRYEKIVKTKSKQNCTFNF